jgi:hypothetical protein
LDDLHHIAAHTFDLDDSTTKFPSKILYPEDFYPLSNSSQQTMTEEFISVPEDFLGVKRTPFSIAKNGLNVLRKKLRANPY